MHQTDAEMRFGDYLQVIKNRKEVAICFFLSVVFVVAGASFMMEPVYRATATLLIDLQSPDVLTTTGSVALSGTDYYAYKEYFQSQKELIKSRSIISQVFEEFKLGEGQDYLKEKDQIETFAKTIKVEPVRDTRILLLHVDNKDPKLAKALANRIADIYVARNLSYITKAEVINLLKNEYLKLQAKLAEYSKTYKHKHPKMLRLNQEIEQMAERINEEKEKIASSDFTGKTPMDYETSGLGLAGIKANNVSIQDRAEVPKLPIRPKKRLNILLALIVGLFAGLGLAFFYEYLDDTVRGVEDIERLVKWPFLGNIPHINGKRRLTEQQKDIFVYKRPNDPITEAYRAVRTSILFSSTEEHPLKSLIITSAAPREGKTTTLCNLGIILAQNNKRVLLVDADMRKPILHEIFERENNVGLSSYLCEQAEFKDLVQQTEVENLFLVSCGPHSPNPSELLSSQKMTDFINKAKNEFEFILFDTSPIGVLTDASILARAADGVILVLESENTSKRALPRVSQLLEEARARVVGVLLNKIDTSRNGYHCYRYYYGKE